VFGVSLVDPRLAIPDVLPDLGLSIAVLYGKYAAGDRPPDVLLNRALRIYPPYFIVLVGAILVSLYA